MKYSLRNFMLVVTLVCVGLGGRIEYLRQWATFHEREAAADLAWNAVQLGEAKGLKLFHEAKAAEYRAAMWRPWTIVEECEL